MGVHVLIEEGTDVHIFQDGSWHLLGTVKVADGFVQIVPVDTVDDLPDGYFAPDDAPKIPSPFLPDRRDLPEGVELDVVYGSKAETPEQAAEAEEHPIDANHPNIYIRKLFKSGVWGGASMADRARTVLAELSRGTSFYGDLARPILERLIAEEGK